MKSDGDVGVESCRRRSWNIDLYMNGRNVRPVYDIGFEAIGYGQNVNRNKSGQCFGMAIEVRSRWT